MEKMQLIVRDFEKRCDSIEPWSVIYVDINNTSFPSNQWWDCSLSIIAVWANNLQRLLYGSISHCTLYFMDGDYSINLSSIEPGKVVASFLDSDQRVSIQETINLVYFARQLLAAIGKIKDHYSCNIDLNVIQNLLSTAKNLKEAITFFTNINREE